MLLKPKNKISDNVNTQGLDILKFKPIRVMVLWSGFPYIFQAAALAAFIALAVFGWGQFAPQGANDKLFAKCSIVTLTIWGLWWPAMVWIAVLLGRVWCMICPLELVANVSERLARRLGVKQHILGKRMRSGILILGLYALIQMLIAGVHLHRVPAYTSMFLWGLLAVAAFVGFFFKDRAFCKGFCPVGLLLSIYGRGGIFAVRRNATGRCTDCTQKDCTNACNRNKLDARSCPSLLNPSKLNDSADCLLCCQCIKSCSFNNMQLLMRRPFHHADTRKASASWPVTLFIMMVSGFVSYELCTEWKAAKSFFLWLPKHVTELFGLTAYSGWIKGVWTLFLYPLTLWSMLGLLILLFYRISLLDAWKQLALPVAVVVAAGHMAKGVVKFASWGGFVPLAFKEPAGIDTALKVSTKLIPQPESFFSISVVSVIGIALIMIGSYFALREGRLVKKPWLTLPILVMTVCFTFIVYGWGFFYP